MFSPLEVVVSLEGVACWILDGADSQLYTRAFMKKTLRFVLPLTLLVLVAFPYRSPAPIIYREGEGFNLGDEAEIEIKRNAQEQYDLAERYEAAHDYKRAGASYRSVVHRFPRSDIAARAQFKSGEMLERLGKLQAAFSQYQVLVDRYSRSPDFEAALQRQYQIAKAYLDGKPVELFGIPTLPSMEKAQEMFTKIVRNAPYSRIAPLAQFGVGQALEKSGSITATVNAYQQVVDRYPSSDVADSAMYQIGYTYLQASRETGYDETAAIRAQEAFEDFLLRYPNSEKVPQVQDNLRILQGRKTENSFNIARFYDKQRNYKAAYVYYNEVLQQQPDSAEATRAKLRMDQIRAKVGETALTIGTQHPQVGQTLKNGKPLQAQVDTSARPDFVGPPAPAPTPSARPEQGNPEQRPLRTPPADVAPEQPSAIPPASAAPATSPAPPASAMPPASQVPQSTPAPAEPALPSQ
ncbi:MAG: outer membrane protein assembly factor BamD [Verrucomicrobia bacterium]|nr:outer membrane protein assembly factor BamD [Verrucomicrobiota bacterium]